MPSQSIEACSGWILTLITTGHVHPLNHRSPRQRRVKTHQGGVEIHILDRLRERPRRDAEVKAKKVDLGQHDKAWLVFGRKASMMSKQRMCIRRKWSCLGCRTCVTFIVLNSFGFVQSLPFRLFGMMFYFIQLCCMHISRQPYVDI